MICFERISTSRSGFFLALVPPARFERAACGVGIRSSVQLSYGGIPAVPALPATAARQLRPWARSLRCVTKRKGDTERDAQPCLEVWGASAPPRRRPGRGWHRSLGGPLTRPCGLFFASRLRPPPPPLIYHGGLRSCRTAWSGERWSMRFSMCSRGRRHIRWREQQLCVVRPRAGRSVARETHG